MRNLFLALVLANLAVAAWTQWFAAAPVGAVIEDPAETGSLTLVSELGVAPDEGEPAAETTSPTDSAAGEPESAAGVSSAPRCVSLGPFRELSQAATAAANLRSGGLRPTQRVGEGDIWVGYWVHLPELGSRSEADQVLANLRANGVSDSYIVPGGDNGHTISLGVFSEIKRAGRRREEVRRLGLNPQVVDRNRRGTVYWVDLTLAPGEELSPEKLQALPGRIIRLEQRDCNAPA